MSARDPGHRAVGSQPPSGSPHLRLCPPSSRDLTLWCSAHVRRRNSRRILKDPRGIIPRAPPNRGSSTKHSGHICVHGRPQVLPAGPPTGSVGAVHRLDQQQVHRVGPRGHSGSRQPARGRRYQDSCAPVLGAPAVSWSSHSHHSPRGRAGGLRKVGAEQNCCIQ